MKTGEISQSRAKRAEISSHARVLVGAVVLKDNEKYLQERLTQLELKDDIPRGNKIAILLTACMGYEKRFEAAYQLSMIMISDGLDSKSAMDTYDGKMEEAKTYLDSMHHINKILLKLGYREKNREFMQLYQEFMNHSFYKE